MPTSPRGISCPAVSPAIDAHSGSSDWRRSLAQAVRDPDELITRLELHDSLREPARRAAETFPLMVPVSFLARMEPGNPHDPLLRQVLPVGAEEIIAEGFAADAVGDGNARAIPGLLQKYEGRALLIAAGSCAVNCRYCFRRHYPYGEEPRRLDDWQPALDAIAGDPTLHEVILSGGDPLMLTDHRLREMVERIAAIPHVTRLRIHSRLPIVLPDRVNDDLLNLLHEIGPAAVMVVHANHPNEIVGDCAAALQRLVQSGIPTLNQSVLLRGVNDAADTLAALSERLIECGVIPYYLHQLDRVSGAAHFEVAEATGLKLIDELRRRLPGYLVPRYVREIAGEPSKSPIS
ncbi:MAG: EF-P beta-lysylation protein EpmB [Planctomycetaceae bacterium]|nr:EF-P beta-lysylation protein EpmB [Planctomycetaceae bacterium]